MRVFLKDVKFFERYTGLRQRLIAALLGDNDTDSKQKVSQRAVAKLLQVRTTWIQLQLKVIKLQVSRKTVKITARKQEEHAPGRGIILISYCLKITKIT